MTEQNNQNRPQQAQPGNRPQSPPPATHPQDEKVEGSANLLAKDMLFGMRITTIVQQLIDNTLSSQDARKLIQEWILANPDFTLEEANTTIERLKGSVETVAQEIPRMFHRW